MEKKVWFITGVSSGFGQALVEVLVDAGYQVVGTLRKDEQVAAFNSKYGGKAHAVKMDVTNREQVVTGYAKALEVYGHIDVVVNNAGYGFFGAIEEVSEQEARDQMETNFFGALWVTQQALPVMRAQKSGHIVQISSMAGMRGGPGVGIYNASKHALEGFSEALALEVAPFNIKVTIVEPGPFRTKWAGESAARSEKVIDAYEDTPAGKRIAQIQGYSGQQPGDPVKGAKAIIKAVESTEPPLRLPLGSVAVDAILDKLHSVEQEIKKWEKVSLDTHFD
ncbi:MAG: oxidoreductase [Flavipsychrobacter sp.]|nr:oxidoreductase [Flavipsychrobacter sp.]